MSYETWHEYGYGICVDDIDTTEEKVFALVHLAPNFEKIFYNWIESFREDRDPESIAELITMNDIYEYDGDNYCDNGIGPIVSAVIKECEDIELLSCADFDCNHYIIFPTMYPWCMSEKEKNMTEEDIKEIFTKYIRVLTDQEIDISYQSVENGG